VRRLPHELVEAFRSTLDEVADANLLLHVVDAADEDPDRQIAAVRAVLHEIGAGEIPELVAINKIDIAEPEAVARLRSLHPGAVAISAHTGAGIDDLEDAIVAALQEQSVDMELMIPYDRGDMLAALHRVGEVIDLEHADGGTHVKARLPHAEAQLFAQFQPR
jgi:GTP-binding protein HflX